MSQSNARGRCVCDTDELAASCPHPPCDRGAPSVEGLMGLVQDHGDYCRDELPEASAREFAAIRAYAERLASEAAPAAQPATPLREVLERIIQATHSHVDGRDLLAELHPRNTLDIKRRVDARETWFEGDWLSNLWTEIKAARTLLAASSDEAPKDPYGY